MSKTKSVKRVLYETLRDGYRDKDFTLSIGSIAQHDEDRQTIINFIKQKKKPTDEEVLLLAVELNQQRYPERYID